MNIHWPKIELPDGFGTVESYLRHLVEEGAKSRYGGINTQVSARMEEEWNCLNGYEPYFLILHDIIGFLNEVNKVSFVVRLTIDKMHIRPSFLDVQQNLCHRLRTVHFRLPRSKSIQVRTV